MSRYENEWAALGELVKTTPSSVAKLIAAWDGLSSERQIELLRRLPNIRYPGYLVDKIRMKALASKNAYVRYLAARQFRFENQSDERSKAKRIIDNDPDALVRYAVHEADSWIRSPWKDPSDFFAAPHEKRLAMLRNLRGHGEHVAPLIEYAVNNGLPSSKVSEIEIYELLEDYLQSENLQEELKQHMGYDGFWEFTKGKDLDALWNLVPKVPEAISHVLLSHLPESAGLSSGPSTEILEGLNRAQWNTLLFRDDIRLTDWRKKFFFQESTNDIFEYKYAAVSRHLNLSEEDFESIIQRPEEQRKDLLMVLAMSARDLRLVYYEVLQDLLKETEGAWEEVQRAKETLEHKLRDVSRNPSRYTYQIHELRLYKLAKELVQYGSASDQELSVILNALVENDVWATYKKLRASWAPDRYWAKGKRFQRRLPRIEEIDGYESDLPWSNDEECQVTPEAVAKRVASRIDAIVSSQTSEDEDPLETLKLLIIESVRGTRESEAALAETMRTLAKEFTGLRSQMKDIRFFLVFLGAGVGILLLSALFSEWS